MNRSQCLFQLQEQVLNVKRPVMMNSLEQSDAEDALVEWMESAHIDNAWKLAPRWSQSESIQASWSAHGVNLTDDLLRCAELVEGDGLEHATGGTIEDSIRRVSDLVKAGKGLCVRR